MSNLNNALGGSNIIDSNLKPIDSLSTKKVQSGGQAFEGFLSKGKAGASAGLATGFNTILTATRGMQAHAPSAGGTSAAGMTAGNLGGVTQASFGGASNVGTSSAALSTDGASGGTGADAMNNMRAQGTSDAMFLLQFQMAMQKDAATLQCQSQIAKCTHDMQKSITQNISA